MNQVVYRKEQINEAISAMITFVNNAETILENANTQIDKRENSAHGLGQGAFNDKQLQWNTALGNIKDIVGQVGKKVELGAEDRKTHV